MFLVYCRVQRTWFIITVLMTLYNNSIIFAISGSCGSRFLASFLSSFYWMPDIMNFTFSESRYFSLQSLSRVQLFVTPWITVRQASLSITNSRSSPKLMCIESVIPLVYWTQIGLALPQVRADYPAWQTFTSKPLHKSCWCHSDNLPALRSPDYILGKD